MRSHERGDGKFGLFVLILLLAIVIFVLVKVVPPRVNAYEFKDFIETYARTESWNHSPEQIKKDFLEKAMSLKLNVDEKNITINKQGANVAIRVTFDVPVDLKVYTWVLHYDFNQTAEHY
jgi:hypothetical protein